ncbi:NAD(P)H-dependent FAD/FMN reductase [Lacunisphaera limnophila]|uniref:NAD(P)H-dependent FAD/FMN reductase n=1 Tax=Lacunisphaera limnophila TaxID=1838286 RepID=A0A1D8AYM2_9BACT|nr:NAD(P)H-dependent oxidoreductase [Lacunisphaera limnophila]AOS45977.1 NAD(P)H-dependent FAD/FMN reductase [Lacunisphaera limnophila]
MILVLSASLGSESNSRLLAQEAVRQLLSEGIEAELIDLRDHPLPPCDGESAYGHPGVAPLRARIMAAEALIVATPIYNYDVNSALKNAIELTGKAWENKPVAFLCAAGGKSSYMAIMALANSLMLDFRCLIVPRFVYATGGDFAEGRVVNPEQVRRIGQLVEATVRLTKLPPLT